MRKAEQIALETFGPVLDITQHKVPHDGDIVHLGDKVVVQDLLTNKYVEVTVSEHWVAHSRIPFASACHHFRFRQELHINKQSFLEFLGSCRRRLIVMDCRGWVSAYLESAAEYPHLWLTSTCFADFIYYEPDRGLESIRFDYPIWLKMLFATTLDDMRRECSADFLYEELKKIQPYDPDPRPNPWAAYTPPSKAR